MSEEVIRVFITRVTLTESGGFRVFIKKGPNKMTTFNTYTRRGARKAADRYLKTRGKYTHPVKYEESY